MRRRRREGRRVPRVAGLAAAGAAALALAAGVAAPGAGAAGTTPLRAAASPSPTLGDLTTFGYGNSRSDDDVVDPQIHGLAASASWDATLDGSVYAQPLVYDGLVYVATENDSIYALFAATGKVAWRVHVGNPVSTTVIDTAPTLGNGCGDISPLGITGTPVIDRATHELFAAEETEVGGNGWQDVRHKLVAVSLTTHHELWARNLDPPHANTANHYYIAAEQQRPAATILGARVYVEYGGLSGDCGEYHGYVVSLPTNGKGGLESYQVPTQREGGIWGVGGAFVSPTGDLYVATGNGSSNSTAHFDEGNSVVELSPSLHRLGYYAPSDWVQLNDADWDLGSANPIAVPGTSLLFAAGKPGSDDTPGFLMRDAPLGGIGHGAFAAAVCPSGGVFGADASYVSGSGRSAHVYLYAPCGGGTEAVEVHVTSPISFHRAWAPSTGDPNGPPMVGGGYVWALDWNGSELYGMNPLTGHVVFQRSTDSLNHFVAPSLGDGAIYVPTTSGVEAFRTS